MRLIEVQALAELYGFDGSQAPGLFAFEDLEG